MALQVDCSSDSGGRHRTRPEHREPIRPDPVRWHVPQGRSHRAAQGQGAVDPAHADEHVAISKRLLRLARRGVARRSVSEVSGRCREEAKGNGRRCWNRHRTVAAELYPMARWILLSAFTSCTTQSTTRFDQLPSLSFRRGFGVRISASLVRDPASLARLFASSLRVSASDFMTGHCFIYIIYLPE